MNDKGEKKILRVLIKGSPERGIYFKGREDAKKEALFETDDIIRWVTGRILTFREVNREYNDKNRDKRFYSEDYIRAYEEILTKILSPNPKQ